MRNAGVIHIYGIEDSRAQAHELTVVSTYLDKAKKSIATHASRLAKSSWLYPIKNEVRVVACPIDLADGVDSFELDNFKASEKIIKQSFPKATIVYYGVNYEASISSENTEQSILDNLKRCLPEDSMVFLGKRDTTKAISLDEEDKDENKSKISLSKAYYPHTAKITQDIVYQQIASRTKGFVSCDSLVAILDDLCAEKKTSPKNTLELCANMFLAHSILTLIDELENSAKNNSEKMRAISAFYDSNRTHMNHKPLTDRTGLLIAVGILDISLMVACSIGIGCFAGAAIGGVGAVFVSFLLTIAAVAAIILATASSLDYLDRMSFFSKPDGKAVYEIKQEAKNCVSNNVFSKKEDEISAQSFEQICRPASV